MASNLLDYAKRVAVRRVVYVLVALVLGFIGIGRAEAQGAPACGNNPITCTRSQAESALANQTETLKVCFAVYGNDPLITGTTITIGPNPPEPADQNGGMSISAYYKGNYNGGTANLPCGWRAFYYKEKDCSAEPDILERRSFKNMTMPKMCEDGCEYDAAGCSAVVVDGFEFTTCTSWTANGATCGATTPSENAPSDGDGDGSSDGNDPAPNNPGEGGGGKEGQPGKDGSQGEGSEGSGPGGKQGNGPGEGSGNGNTAGGGGDCGSPPSVQGDAALAMVAYQGWRTACAVEAGNKAASDRAGTGSGT